MRRLTIRPLALLAATLLTLLPATAQTQQQRGVARMITRSKTDAVVPVSGVSVVVRGSAPKASDVHGNFKLTVTKNREGSYMLTDVRVPKNSNLILASPRLSDKQYLNSGNLVLAFTTAEDKQRVYKAQYDKLQAKYDQQSSDLQQLRNKLRRQKANLEEGTQAYAQLKHQLDSVQSLLNQYFDEKQQENITKDLQRIAEQLAMTDYQSLDSLSQQQYELKAAGDWPSLSKLLLQRMNGDAATYMQQKKKDLEEARENKAITARLDAIATENLSQAERAFSRSIEDIKDAIEAFKMQHLNDSVSRYYEILVAADSTNFGALSEAGMFEQDYTAHYDRARAYFEMSLRSTDIDTLRATAYNNLGGLYNFQGDYVHAEEYHQKALKIFLAVCGEQHPYVGTSYNNLGSVYYNMNDYARAMVFFQKALKIFLTIYSEQNNYVATSYNNLGGVYDSQGDYVRAEEYYQKALKIRLNIFGELHPNVAISYDNLGGLYRDQGNYTRAEEYDQIALKIRLAVFGEQHPDVALSYNNLGTVYGYQGNYVGAEEYCQKALKIWLAAYGEQHSLVAHSYSNLAYLYNIQGDYALAVDYMHKAQKILLAVFGEHSSNMANSYNELGRIYNRQGDYTHAEEYLQKALKLQLSIFGELHRDVASSYNELGALYYSQGDNIRAMDYFSKALDIAKVVLGEAHPYTKSYQKNLDYIQSKVLEQEQ